MSRSRKEIDRDKITVGQVVNVTEFVIQLSGENNNYTKEDEIEISINSYIPYRSILFYITPEKRAGDLIYSSHDYPILNISDNEACLESGILVNDIYNMGSLLKYFGYKKYLSKKQIPEIRNRFFSGRFGMDHCNLFGMEEIIPEEFKPMENGIEIIDPEKRYEFYKKSIDLDTERSFIPTKKGIFPHELMFYLDSVPEMYSHDPFVPRTEESFVYIKK